MSGEASPAIDAGTHEEQDGVMVTGREIFLALVEGRGPALVGYSALHDLRIAQAADDLSHEHPEFEELVLTLGVELQEIRV